MRIALDTNVLLYLLNKDVAEHENVAAAMTQLESSGATFCITPQNLVEFWGVSTRPARDNGLGLSVSQAAERIELLESAYELLVEDERIFSVWRQLVIDYRVQGKQVHDTRLAAALQVHGISTLLTADAGGFQRFPFLNVITPNGQSKRGA